MTVNTDSTQDVRAKWGEAFDLVRKAGAAFRRYAEATDPLYQLEKAYCAEYNVHPQDLRASGSPYAVPEAVGDERDRLCDEFAAAETLLMATPAPDLAALRWKLDHTSDTQYSDHYTAQMRADIERLMGPAPCLLDNGVASGKAQA